MLPFEARDLYPTNSKSKLLDGRFPDYIRRLADVRQMDFEATFDQLILLTSTEPQRV